MGILDGVILSRNPVDLWEQELLNHCIAHGTSFLCAKTTEIDKDLEIHFSDSGYFLGTEQVGKQGFIRDSQYFEFLEEAEKALEGKIWEQRMDL